MSQSVHVKGDSTQILSTYHVSDLLNDSLQKLPISFASALRNSFLNKKCILVLKAKWQVEYL